jgi:flagellar basal body-associated protein FliL
VKKKLIIIIAVVVVVVAGGIFAYMQFFSGNNEEPAEEQLTYFETGEYLVTNLKDENSLVKLTVVLGIPKDTDTAVLTEGIAAIRDRVVYVMRGHSKEDFAEQSSMDALSQELCQAINAELGVDYVKRIYFYDFVIQ